MGLPEGGQQPVVPLPKRDPAALRAAVARLDVAAVAKFESEWTAATARARDEYSLNAGQVLRGALVDLGGGRTLAAESADRAARRAAAAEISEILRRAESATA